MIMLLIVVILAVCGAAEIVVLKLADLRRLQVSLLAFELRFPRGQSADSVIGLLAGVSGLLPPWWRRWLVSPFVIFETSATEDGIAHHLLVPEAWAPALENLLQASVPNVGYQPVELPPPSSLSTAPGWSRSLRGRPARGVVVGAEYRLNNNARALRVDPAVISAQLLASLQPLGHGERIKVQWTLSSAGPVSPPRVARPGDRSWFGPPRGTVADAEAASALKTKQAHPLLLAVARIGVDAGSTPRARLLLRHVEVAWHGSRAPGVQLQRRPLSETRAATRLLRRSVPLFEWPGSFNVAELAGLIGLPVEASAVPGLLLGGCRQLPASPRVVRRGTVIADSSFPGDRRPLALDERARLRHVHVVGPTGTGKSTLLINMIAQDLTAGHGLVIVDPKGDLANDVLARIPEHRQGDVIVLDPADQSRSVGLNPLRAARGKSSEVVVENLLGLFKSLYRTSWGPRTDDVLRAALMTLAVSGDTTLCEVPLLLSDPTYRRRLVGQLDDPVGLESFWGWYEALSDGERLTVIGPVLNKVRAFSMRPQIRAIIGQANPALNLTDVLGTGKVLIVSLATGLLGSEAASLLGALVIAELWHATTARAGQPQRSRRPVFAYLDEWQHFLHLPTPMASVLAEARGLGLGMTLAHQHLGQLPEAARDAVLANARSRVIFQLPAGDARLLTKELGGLLGADDLQGLGAFEVVTQLFAGGSTQPPATARTRPDPPTCSDPGRIRAISNARYAVSRDQVEAAIRARQTNSRHTDRVGRRHDRDTSGDGK